MIRPTLRLVVDEPSDPLIPVVTVPVTGTTTLHVHLHVGAPANIASAIPTGVPEPAGTGPTEARLIHKAVIAMAACALAFISYQIGTHASPGRIAPATPSTLPQAAMLPNPAEMPPALRQQLALPPTVSPPPGSTGGPTAVNPFGLHP